MKSAELHEPGVYKFTVGIWPLKYNVLVYDKTEDDTRAGNDWYVKIERATIFDRNVTIATQEFYPDGKEYHDKRQQ